MQNDGENILSDADRMKEIWKYVENEWDGELGCPVVMGSIVSFYKKRLQQLLIKD